MFRKYKQHHVGKIKKKIGLIFTFSLIFHFFLFRSLTSNQLSTLPRGLIDEASRLNTLTLDDNPWVCDCRLNWMILWLQSTTRVSRNTATSKMPVCMEPFEYQGQRLTSIRPLQCSSTGKKDFISTHMNKCSLNFWYNLNMEKHRKRWQKVKLILNS